MLASLTRRSAAPLRFIEPLRVFFVHSFLTEIASPYETKDTFAIKSAQLVAHFIGLGLRPPYVGDEPVLFLRKVANSARGGDKLSFGGLDGRPSLCNLAGKSVFFGIELLNFCMHGRELSLRGLDHRLTLRLTADQLISFSSKFLNFLPRASDLAFRGLDSRFGLCKIGIKLTFFRDERANSLF
jgi:hypothetical protein